MEKTENELIFDTGDSAMTIEYLRARLLSERLVSRSAKQRADELAEWVVELEEQLKVVYHQRKKTEKATSDVLAILGSLGISDDSEGFDMSSDQELTHPQVFNDNCLEKNKDKSRSMDRNGCEPTTFSCRSLSWKSRRCSSHCESKFISAPSRRRSSLLYGDFISPVPRLGKSCRQVKRKELRSTADELSENGATMESQIADDDSKTSICHRGCQDEKLSADDAVSICIAARPKKMKDSELHFHEHEGDREMEIALERRAELICRYEAEENAQIEWEEKYKEHKSSTPESVEPGSQSDVTEERDELRQPASDQHVNEDMNTGVKDARTNEVCRILSNEDDVQRQPSLQTTLGSQKSENVDSEMCTSHPENAVHMNEPKQTQDKPECCLSSLSDRAAANSNHYEGETSNTAIRKSVCMPREASKDLGNILEALQRAKLSLQHKMRKLPVSEDGFIVKAEESLYNPARAQIPASCAALFRVPTDTQTEENVHKTYSDSRSHPTLRNCNHDPTSAVSSSNQIKLKPQEGVAMSNGSDGSSFDFVPYWKTTSLSSLCNREDSARSSSVLSEKGFSNSDRYKLSPQFGTPRSSFTGSDGHAQSPLPDFHLGFLTNHFDGSSYPLSNNRSRVSRGDLHAQGLYTNGSKREFNFQPEATTPNGYCSSRPTQLLVNTSSSSSQPFSPEPHCSVGTDISLSSNDRLVYKPSNPSIHDLNPTVPIFRDFISQSHLGLHQI